MNTRVRTLIGLDMAINPHGLVIEPVEPPPPREPEPARVILAWDHSMPRIPEGMPPESD
jgi:hypothetical protein